MSFSEGTYDAPVFGFRHDARRGAMEDRFEGLCRAPVSALTLAYQLIAIKQSLQRGPKGTPDAIAGLDLAIDSLFPHMDFYKMAHKFYIRTIEGRLKPQQEEKLRQLGLKV